MADGVEIGVDAAVLQHAGGLGGLDPLDLEVLVGVDAGGLEQVHGIDPLTGAGGADIDDLALEVGDAVDVLVGRGQDGHRLGMDGEHGAQLLLRLAFPLALAVVGLALEIRLHYPQLDVAVHQGVDVEDRAARRFDRHAQVVFAALLVDQLADGAAGGVVDPGHPAGADGHEAGGGPSLPRSPGPPMPRRTATFPVSSLHLSFDVGCRHPAQTAGAECRLSAKSPYRQRSYPYPKGSTYRKDKVKMNFLDYGVGVRHITASYERAGGEDKSGRDRIKGSKRRNEYDRS